jgi:hypothetical protein
LKVTHRGVRLVAKGVGVLGKVGDAARRRDDVDELVVGVEHGDAAHAVGRLGDKHVDDVEQRRVGRHKLERIAARHVRQRDAVHDLEVLARVAQQLVDRRRLVVARVRVRRQQNRQQVAQLQIADKLLLLRRPHRRRQHVVLHQLGKRRLERLAGVHRHQFVRRTDARHFHVRQSLFKLIH